MDTTRVFLFIIVAFWTLTSHSQYSPVIENEAKWVIQKAELEFYFPQEIILGDTNADGSINLLSTDFVSGDSVPSGTVWQNSDNSKIWYSKTGSETDSVLIYDMNLLVGDTFYFIPNISYFSIVDSVYWESGLKIIRFMDQPYNFNEKYKFVEGVGPSFGLNYLLNNDAHTQFCTCKFNGDSLFWHTSLSPFQDCYVTNISDFENQNGLTVFPNPARDFVTLKIQPEFFPVNVSIFTIQGEMIFAKQVQSADFVIDIVALPPGIYFIEARGENVLRGKFVKE